MSSNSRTRRNRPQPARRPAPRVAAPRELPPPRAVEPDDFDEYEDDDTYNEAEDAAPERAQEIEALGHYVSAGLCGESVRVIPPGAWRQSWMRLLNEGKIDDFANFVIHPDDLDLYDDLDPTNDEFGEFVGEAASRAGESLGKSRGPERSTRRTRRR